MEEKKHGCENVFEAIGFPTDKAAALSVRSRLLMAPEEAIKGAGRRQDLIEGLGVQRLSDLMNRDDISIDRLIMLLARAGKQVSVAIS